MFALVFAEDVAWITETTHRQYSLNVVSNSDCSPMKLAVSSYFDNISYHSYVSPKQDLKTKHERVSFERLC